MKSGNLNFPEPSGPVQACNGTAFTFTNSETAVSIQKDAYVLLPEGKTENALDS